MEAGQQPTARFVVRNAGKSPLQLGALSSGCYCVSYKATPGPIAPGESALVELIYTQKQLGQVTDAAVLASNDPTGDTKLTLKAVIVASLAPQSMMKESGMAVPFK